jgi:hypothetical protein
MCNHREYAEQEPTQVQGTALTEAMLMLRALKERSAHAAVCSLLDRPAATNDIMMVVKFHCHTLAMSQILQKRHGQLVPNRREALTSRFPQEPRQATTLA